MTATKTIMTTIMRLTIMTTANAHDGETPSDSFHAVMPQTTTAMSAPAPGRRASS